MNSFRWKVVFLTLCLMVPCVQAGNRKLNRQHARAAWKQKLAKSTPEGRQKLMALNQDRKSKIKALIQSKAKSSSNGVMTASVKQDLRAQIRDINKKFGEQAKAIK